MFGAGNEAKTANRSRAYLNRLVASATAMAVAAMIAQPAAAETKSWVVSWLDMAMYSQDGDCPDGLNPSIEELYRFDLKALGYDPGQVNEIAKNISGGGVAAEILTNRARINGKPANAYTHPMQAPDPKLHALGGRYAYGFNLDGKGAASPNSFEDPETHEKGVNNQMVRAFGCSQSSRASPPPDGGYPKNGAYWGYSWDVVRDTMPAWVITVTGQDLSKDGEVTVDFERAVDHILRDANGETLAGMAFRIATDPRSRNHYKGVVKDGTIFTQPAELHMEGDDFLITQFDIKAARMRLHMRPNGNLEGIFGGYQTWMPVYFMYGGANYASENAVGVDFVGIFHILRRLADAEPDPKTGQNQRISAAYRVLAVPAIAVPPAETNKTAQSGSPALRTASVP